jgi:hypothetical protein
MLNEIMSAHLRGKMFYHFDEQRYLPGKHMIRDWVIGYKFAHAEDREDSPEDFRVELERQLASWPEAQLLVSEELKKIHMEAMAWQA